MIATKQKFLTTLTALKRGAAASLLGLALASPNALADAPKKPNGFPDRPLTMIVPFGAGGGSDQMARAIAGPLQEVMGVPIQVVNKPGGGGRAAIPDFMAAPADGYTLMQFSDDVPTLYAAGRITENPTKDWTPIGLGNIVFSQIYIHGDETRFKDWDSFVEYAKNNKVTMANVSHKGSMELISMQAVADAKGLTVQQISYDKPTERYAALVGKHVDALFEQPSDVANFLEAGKMKPILTFLKERPKAFADVKALDDIGVDFEPLLRVRGIFIRADVPQDRKDYLEAAFAEAYKSKDFQDFLKKKYMTIIDSYADSAQSIKILDDMLATYRKAYKDLGLQ